MTSNDGYVPQVASVHSYVSHAEEAHGGAGGYGLLFCWLRFLFSLSLAWFEKLANSSMRRTLSPKAAGDLLDLVFAVEHRTFLCAYPILPAERDDLPCFA